MNSRPVVLTGAGMVGVWSASASSVSLYRLAERCHFTPDPLPAALPISLDVLAAVGGLVWIFEKGKLRRWGQALALGALLGTLAGNAAEHAIAAGLLVVGLPLILAVGAVIPAALFCCTHLAAMVLAGCPTPASRKVRQAAPQAARSQLPAPRVGTERYAPKATTTAIPETEATLPDRIASFLVVRRDMRARAGKPTETPAEENQAVVEKFGCSEISLKRGRKRAKETQLAEARS